MKLSSHAVVTKILNWLELLPKPLRSFLYVSLRAPWLIFIWYPQSYRIQKHLRQFISPGDLVFDVGANKGMIAEIFLRLGAKVICIEPQPDCVNILLRKFKNNKNIIIVGKGLGDAEKTLTMYINEKNPALSTFSDDWKRGRYSDEKWSKKLTIDITTLDKLIEQYGIPRFCKIDVEGYEQQVLRGLHYKIPLITFEFLKENIVAIKKCIDYIETIGEASFNISDENGHSGFLLKEWGNSDQLFHFLDKSTQHDLAGDIYARFK